VRNNVQSLLTRSGSTHLKAGAVKLVSDQAQDRRVIVHDEDALESRKSMPQGQRINHNASELCH
jgi:hypothetical protein